MINSGLYGGGSSITKNSKLNEVNSEKAGRLDAMEADEKQKYVSREAYEAGSAEGANNAYLDVMERLNSSESQFTPVDQFSQPQEYLAGNANFDDPGLLDLVDSGQGNSANWAPQESVANIPEADFAYEQGTPADLKQLLGRPA